MVINLISKTLRFCLPAILILCVMASAGCVRSNQGPDATPTVQATATVTPVPTVTPAPVDPTVERQYQYIEYLYSGIEGHNRGIGKLRQAQMAANESDWKNASVIVLEAKQYMENAGADFKAMEPYAMYPDETNLSKKWYQTTEYAAKGYSFMSDAFLEREFQDSRDTPNYVKYNYYVEQANHYNDLSQQIRIEAEKLQNSINATRPR